MKSLVYITAYAKTLEKQRLLLDCIQSVKSFGMDVLVSSHAPLPEHIINEVDYYIYDKDNRFNRINGTTVWKQVNNIRIDRYVTHAHQYPIIRLLRSAFHIAKAHGYDFVWGTDFDCIYSQEDVHKLKELQDVMVRENKKFVLFHPKDASWTIDDRTVVGEFYDSYIMGGYVDSWIRVFDEYFPQTLDGYNHFVLQQKAYEPQCFEYYMYDALRPYQSDVLAVDGYIKDYLRTSSINNSALVNTGAIILSATDGKDYLYLNYDEPSESVFTVSIDQTSNEEYVLSGISLGQSFKLIELHHNCDISVVVRQENKIIGRHDIRYRKEDAHLYAEAGKIIITTG